MSRTPEQQTRFDKIRSEIVSLILESININRRLYEMYVRNPAYKMEAHETMKDIDFEKNSLQFFATLK